MRIERCFSISFYIVVKSVSTKHHMNCSCRDTSVNEIFVFASTKKSFSFGVDYVADRELIRETDQQLASRNDANGVFVVRMSEVIKYADQKLAERIDVLGGFVEGFGEKLDRDREERNARDDKDREERNARDDEYSRKMAEDKLEYDRQMAL